MSDELACDSRFLVRSDDHGQSSGDERSPGRGASQALDVVVARDVPRGFVARWGGVPMSPRGGYPAGPIPKAGVPSVPRGLGSPRTSKSKKALSHGDLEHVLSVLSDRFDELMHQADECMESEAYRTSLLRTFRAAGVLDALNYLRQYREEL